MADCFYHTGKPSPTRCKLCGRPLCLEWQIVQHGGIFCSENCANAFGAFIKRAKEIESKKRKTSSVAPIIRTAVFLIVLFVIYFIIKKFLLNQ